MKLMKEQLKDYYNSEFFISLEKKVNKSRVGRLIKLMKLNNTDIVAEFGCGSGIFYEFIKDKIKEYFGIDYSKEGIELANKKFANFSNNKFFIENINEFCPKYPDFFDKIFTLDFSEHLYNEDFIEIFQNINKTLKKGGILYIYTPNGDYFLEILKEKGLLKQNPSHVAVRNANEYKNLLEKFGFKKIHIQEIAHFNIMKYLHFLSYIPFIGKYFGARLFITCKK